ncbi:F-box protein At5g46170-like [Malania oleifera]|uniref:F-box protein At5g46170-like n=1 Tax=Malania oleifera TaxID=397392 RepID=UPI0025AE9EC9|nr:F-box protein At5g46170-like [Malania oleifera]
MNEHKQHEEDHFSRLPDDLVRLIFATLRDARSLSLCCAVSKRFSSLAPQTDDVSVSFRRQKPRSGRRGVFVSFFKILVNKLISKPLRCVHQIGVPDSVVTNSDRVDSFPSLDLVLKQFSEVKSLHLELPSHGREFGSGGKSLLKWSAEFGSALESCAILGATSFQKSKPNGGKSSEEQRDQRERVEPSCTGDELKLRVVWMISCLIAASARHYMVNRMILDHPMLESVVITDSKGQGRMRMGEEQMKKARSSENSPATAESTFGRTRVPNLRMNLWFAPRLELPRTGWVMKGATLVTIKAIDGPIGIGSDSEMLAGAFDGEEREDAFREAVRKMVTKKENYIMEMNSF